MPTDRKITAKRGARKPISAGTRFEIFKRIGDVASDLVAQAIRKQRAAE